MTMVFASVRRYWNLYGGWKAILTSPYLYLALFLTAIVFPLWANNGDKPDWSDMSINILPNLMGFSIAGMAVMLAFSHPTTLAVITDGKEESYFLKTIINLVHFLVVQTMALLLAIVAKAFHVWPLNLLGMAVLIYAIVLSIAAACQLFNTARIMNKAAALDARRRRRNDKKP